MLCLLDNIDLDSSKISSGRIPQYRSYNAHVSVMYCDMKRFLCVNSKKFNNFLELIKIKFNSKISNIENILTSYDAILFSIDYYYKLCELKITDVKYYEKYHMSINIKDIDVDKLIYSDTVYYFHDNKLYNIFACEIIVNDDKVEFDNKLNILYDEKVIVKLRKHNGQHVMKFTTNSDLKINVLELNYNDYIEHMTPGKLINDSYICDFNEVVFNHQNRDWINEYFFTETFITVIKINDKDLLLKFPDGLIKFENNVKLPLDHSKYILVTIKDDKIINAINY